MELPFGEQQAVVDEREAVAEPADHEHRDEQVEARERGAGEQNVFADGEFGEQPRDLKRSGDAERGTLVRFELRDIGPV